MSVFSKPAFESKDPDVRLEAVNPDLDPDILLKLAKTDPSSRVRLAAVAAIGDQDQLVRVALDGQEIDARVAAVERIESQEKLAEILKVQKNFQLMGACFAHITKREILEEIATNREYNMAARRMAIENFADESYLEELSLGSQPDVKEKSPEEVDRLAKKYGDVQLARALGKFRGSPQAIVALGHLIQRGGDAAAVALEYVAQGLVHRNPNLADAAQAQLTRITDGALIAKLVGMMDRSDMAKEILNVLKQIDHPEARQVVEAAGQDEVG